MRFHSDSVAEVWDSSQAKSTKINLNDKGYLV